METSENLLKHDTPATSEIQELSTSSPAASPASLFPLQGSDEARQTTATSGRRCYASYATFIRAGSSVKTLAALLLGTEAWYSNKCTLTWKVKVTPSKRLLFQLAPSTPRTAATEFGLLLTPSVVMPEEPPEAFKARKARNGYKNGTTWGSLASQIRYGMLHTPSAQEPGVSIDRLQTKDGQPAKIGQRAYDKETGRLAQVGLTQQIAMLPTPQASEAGHGGPNARDSNGTPHLSARIAMLPTPQAIDGNGEGRELRLKKDCNRDPETPGSWRGDLKDHIGTKPGLKLQPAFVEWMMGYPEGWTELNASKPLATQSSPKSPQR